MQHESSPSNNDRLALTNPAVTTVLPTSVFAPKIKWDRCFGLILAAATDEAEAEAAEDEDEDDIRHRPRRPIPCNSSPAGGHGFRSPAGARRSLAFIIIIVIVSVGVVVFSSFDLINLSDRLPAGFFYSILDSRLLLVTPLSACLEDRGHHHFLTTTRSLLD